MEDVRFVTRPGPLCFSLSWTRTGVLYVLEYTILIVYLLIEVMLSFFIVNTNKPRP